MARVIGAPKFTGGPIGRGGGTGGVTSGIRVIGVPQAIAKLRGAEAYLRLEMGLAVFQGAETIERLAKAYVGKETGNLESGIKMVKTSVYTYEVIASSMAGGNGDKNWYEYAPFHEFGWTDRGGGWHAGRFFLTRAYSEARPGVQARVAAMARAVQRM